MPDPEFFAGGDDVDLLHLDSESDKLRAAAENKARYDAFLRASADRAKSLPREDVRAKAFAATNLMLSNIILGRVKPKSAKEAADVAKITYELGRRETGDEDLATQITTPEQRQAVLGGIKDLLLAAKARAVEDGLIPPEAEILDAEVVDEDDLARGEAAGVPVRSATQIGRAHV